jgi:glycosyltransferase involved in cell wall biosynthesis
MEKIKIILILEATAGGTRRYITQVLLHLNLDIFEPILFCAVKRDPAFLADIELFRKRGIKVEIFPMKRAIAPVSDLWSIFSMSKAIKRENPDIVHTHSSKSGIIGRLAAKLAGVRTILHTPHVFPFEMDVGPLKKKCYLLLERMTAKWTTLLLAVSQAEKAVALKHGMFSDKNAIVNANGIDPDLWLKNPEMRKEMREQAGILADDFVVGMVGRFMPQKGHSILIDAAEILLQKQRKIKFIMVGDGTLKNKIRNLSFTNKINNSFHFFVQVDDIASYYSMFDCLVLPSLWEGCPYTIMEAMAMNIPVIASSVGGVTEIIEDGMSGLLVPAGKADKLAEAIEKLCENRKFCETLGQNGKKRVQDKFLLSDSIAKLEKIYFNLIK